MFSHMQLLEVRFAIFLVLFRPDDLVKLAEVHHGSPVLGDECARHEVTVHHDVVTKAVGVPRLNRG